MGFGTVSIRRNGEEGDILVGRAPHSPWSSSNAKYLTGEDLGKCARQGGAGAAVIMWTFGIYGGTCLQKPLVPAHSY